jgi:misacylated tRNA(Ala) deacylase
MLSLKLEIIMTELIYLEDAYADQIQAEVLEVEDNGIILERTVFYPGGGGQPSDTGQLLCDDLVYGVTRVQRTNGKIWHLIENAEGRIPGVGDRVTAILDWDRRFSLMRTHTAMHILCGVIWRDYQASVTGGNMEPLKGRMDFEFEHMQKELVAEIEEKINLEVQAERSIVVNTLPRDEAFSIPDLIRTKINLLPEGISEVRTVEIKGLDLQADGGTHVANTREVGFIRIVDYRSKGKINKRLIVELEPAR